MKEVVAGACCQRFVEVGIDVEEPDHRDPFRACGQYFLGVAPAPLGPRAIQRESGLQQGRRLDDLAESIALFVALAGSSEQWSKPPSIAGIALDDAFAGHALQDTDEQSAADAILAHHVGFREL